MLKIGDKYHVDTIGWKDGIGFMDGSLEMDDKVQAVSTRERRSDDLEYIWLLLRQDFSYVNTGIKYFPFPERPDAYWDCFCVMRLSYDNFDDYRELFVWDNLKERVREDYQLRRESVFRNRFCESDFDRLLEDCIEDFPYEDRERIETLKLKSLILFAYDYCILSLRESVLHPLASLYIPEMIRIGGKLYKASKTVARAIELFLHDPFQEADFKLPDGTVFQQTVEKNKLDIGVVVDEITPNPKATDSNVSAMFVDLMHRFFNAFGLKKRAEWAPAEKKLIYEMLRFFGLCGSSKQAKETNYITTLAHDHKNYFADCKLHYWIRSEEQAYSYLMCCGKAPLFVTVVEDGQGSNTAQQPGTPFISPVEIYQADLMGESFRRTNTDHPFINYYSAIPKGYNTANCIDPDPALSYVMQLIKENFLYITFVPRSPKCWVLRKDLMSPNNLNSVIGELEQRILHDGDSILRSRFERSAVMKEITMFRERLPKEDRRRFDTSKFYNLFLFVFDYVMFTYKEAALREEIKRYLDTKVELQGHSLRSTAFIDDMMIEYLSSPYVFRENNGTVYREFRDGQLYAPSLTPIVEHPDVSVYNMTAMFYDLFVRFFTSMCFQKRKGAKVSEQEKNLITQLLRISGICKSGQPSTVNSIYLKNKRYFEKSRLAISIRENEYWHLMLNNQEEELFGPPYKHN